jgi:hypothetical protein
LAYYSRFCIFNLFESKFLSLHYRYPDLKIITHHLGGVIPCVEGKVGPGRNSLGIPTTDEDYSTILRGLKKRPSDYFLMFYADTAVFGARAATVCGPDFLGIEHTVFGTDAPLGPRGKWGYTRWTIEVIESFDLSPEVRHAIYEGNVRRLLRLAFVEDPAYPTGCDCTRLCGGAILRWRITPYTVTGTTTTATIRETLPSG